MLQLDLLEKFNGGYGDAVRDGRKGNLECWERRALLF